MRSRLPTARWDERTVLAGLFAAIGIMATAFFVLAPVPSVYGAIDAGAALASASAALAALVLPRRWDVWVVHAGLLVATAIITVLVAARATPQGQASAGYLLALASLYCAVYLPHRQMLAHVGLMGSLFAVASLAGGGELQAFYIGVRVVTVLLLAEVVSRFAVRQRHLLAEIQGQAVHDPLTGALNRRGAVDEAEHVRGVVARSRGTTTVSVLDLDGFKGYNDSRGHAAGDRLLVDIVAAWTRTLRAGDVLARVGGDEFVVVLPQTDPRSAEVLLQRMRAANPFPWSVGTVVWEPEEDLFEATARADERLYVHKLRRRFGTAGPPLEA